MLNKSQMEDVWANKPVNYIKNTYRGKFKKLRLTFTQSLHKSKKLENLYFEFTGKSKKDYYTPEVRAFVEKMKEEGNAMCKKEGFDLFEYEMIITEI